MQTTTTYRHGLAHCPGCQTALVAPFQAAGRVVRCKSCSTRFTLPSPEELFEAAVAYLVDHEEDYEDRRELDLAGRHIRQETLGQAV